MAAVFQDLDRGVEGVADLRLVRLACGTDVAGPSAQHCRMRAAHFLRRRHQRLVNGAALPVDLVGRPRGHRRLRQRAHVCGAFAGALGELVPGRREVRERQRVERLDLRVQPAFHHPILTAAPAAYTLRMPYSEMSRRELLKALAVAPALPTIQDSPTSSLRAPTPSRLQVGIMSRHLQWASVEDAIEVAKTAGFEAIEWTVRPGGHVPPERAERELPRVIELTHRAGLATPMISTSIQDAASPYA